MSESAKTTAGLPSGLVTFVFTDVEGSTRLFQRMGDRFPAALEQHRTIVRSAVVTKGGAVVKTEGDGFFIAFSDAGAAVEGCLEAQLGLSAHPWPEGCELRVRMGLHTGTAERTADNDYLSVVVHRAARIAAAAHGGQVILSAETARHVHRHVPSGASLGDRGVYRLKDFDEPERLFQLLHPGLRSSFPPLRASPVQSRGLPDARMSFIGRKVELKALIDLLGETRLVSVVGPGGAGKTRLALEVAARLATQFGGGAQLCDLSPIVEAGLVPAAIASAMGIDYAARRDPLEAVVQELAGLETLLLLDNCEQVLDGVASAVDALLVGIAGLRVLATSREPLSVAGERVWRVPPLELPAVGAQVEELRNNESGCLFEERARSAHPEFAITTENASAVASLCRRLEGMPLAIELAAAYIGSMPIPTLEARIADRLPTLGKGHRRFVSRHRTLEATIDWSYRLLSHEERRLLTSLAVFVGGFTLDAAEAVGGPAGRLELLVSLVQKSLIVWDSDADRYGMLDSIRQFAYERLSEDGTHLDRALAAHASYVGRLARNAEAALMGPRQAHWLEILSRDHDNIRHAVAYLAADRGDAEEALRILTALARYWMIRANTGEWTATVAPLLERVDTGVSEAVRARALVAATMLFAYQDTSQAARFGETAIEIGRRIGDHATVAEATALLAAVSMFRGEPNPALGEHALIQCRRLNDAVLIGLGLLCYGLTQSEPSQQRRLYEEAVTVTRQSGDDFIRYLVTGNLGNAHFEMGDLDAAQSSYGEALDIGEKLGYDEAIVNVSLGEVLLRKGDLEGAADVLAASLRGGGLSLYGSATAIQGIARYAVARGDLHNAAILDGFADHTKRAIGMIAVKSEAELRAAEVASLRDRLGKEFDAYYTAGASMPWQQVRRLAFDVTARDYR